MILCSAEKVIKFSDHMFITHIMASGHSALLSALWYTCMYIYVYVYMGVNSGVRNVSHHLTLMTSPPLQLTLVQSSMLMRLVDL